MKRHAERFLHIPNRVVQKLHFVPYRAAGLSISFKRWRLWRISTWAPELFFSSKKSSQHLLKIDDSSQTLGPIYVSCLPILLTWHLVINKLHISLWMCKFNRYTGQKLNMKKFICSITERCITEYMSYKVKPWSLHLKSPGSRYFSRVIQYLERGKNSPSKYSKIDSLLRIKLRYVSLYAFTSIIYIFIYYIYIYVYTWYMIYIYIHKALHEGY